MKIALIGYGKMGKAIEHVALERGHTISAKIDIGNPGDLMTFDAETAIEFSQPDAAAGNIIATLQRGIPVISGTTGWLERLEEVKNVCGERNGTFFYASNFSVGVNILFKLNELMARKMNRFPQFDVSIDEVHHLEKKDKPSGTALTLAEGIIRNLSVKKTWSSVDSGDTSKLIINSFRIAEVPGTHVLKYSSPLEDLELKHNAHSREGFALGAVTVAEWIRGKKGVLTMDDFLEF